MTSSRTGASGRRRLLWLLAAVALVGAAAWWFTRPPPVMVHVKAVTKGDVELTIANTRAGTVEACHRAKLSPPSGGQVVRLPVDEGDRVQSGDVLLELWNADLRAQLKLASSQLEASESRREVNCLQARMAERELERMRPLRSKKLVSAEALDHAETESLSRAADCRAATADESVSRARVEVAQAALDRTILRAPFTGIVAKLNGKVGEMVTPSAPGIPTPPAVDLLDCSCLYVSAPMDEVDAPGIRLGMPVRLTLDAMPGRAFDGRVRYIAPYVSDVEKQARTLEVEADFNDAHECSSLLPGYSADMEIILDRRRNVTRIPTEALIEGNKVLVLDEGEIVERPVVVGISNWVFTEILDGLTEGESVIINHDEEGVEAGASARAAP